MSPDPLAIFVTVLVGIIAAGAIEANIWKD